MEERFGIPAKLFDDFLLFRRKKHWLILRNNQHLWDSSHLKLSKTGMRAFQKVGVFVKPTTRLIQIFGPWATKAKIEIDLDQLARLVDGEELSMGSGLEKGYVILCLKDTGVLGLGFFIDGKLRSQLPHNELGWTGAGYEKKLE